MRFTGVARRRNLAACAVVLVLARVPLVLAAGPTQADTPGVSHADADPTPISRTTPMYPREAVCLRQEGEAHVIVTVDESGVPIDFGIERSTGSRSLDKAAANSVMSWRFTPAYRDGVAVETKVRIPVNFELPSQILPDCIDLLGARLESGAGEGASGNQFSHGVTIEAVVQYQLRVSWPFRAGIQLTLRHADPGISKAVMQMFDGLNLVPAGPHEARLALRPLDPGSYVLDMRLADEAFEPIRFTVVAADETRSRTVPARGSTAGSA